MNFFIEPEETFEVEVYVWENDDKNVIATTKAEEAPVNTTPERITFTFRKPNMKDSSDILGKSFVNGEINGFVLANKVLETLLKSWSLEQECTLENLKKLHPRIGQVAGMEATLISQITPTS